MNYDETRNILSILKLNYPQSFKGWSLQQSHDFLNLWSEAFKDDSVQLVAGAVKSIIYSDTREFAPNIGQVKNKMHKLTAKDELTEIEAWGTVKAALRNSGYHAAEEFEKLPPVVKSLVGSPRQLFEWSMMDTSEIDTVVASNFQRSYKVRAKHEKEMQAIPLEVKEALGITTLTEKMKLESNLNKQNRLEGHKDDSK